MTDENADVAKIAMMMLVGEEGRRMRGARKEYTGAERGLRQRDGIEPSNLGFNHPLSGGGGGGRSPSRDGLILSCPRCGQSGEDHVLVCLMGGEAEGR